MASDLSVAILAGTLPLVGVLFGSGATIIVQRGSARESRRRLAFERRQAHRAEVKSSITSYLEAAQHLQEHLYRREHGMETPDLATLVEHVWLAQKQVEIICSEGLREPLERHAVALNEVARHGDEHPEWWEFVAPHSRSMLDAVRVELTWEDWASGEKSKDQVN
jgi:hypothetical protein